MTLEYQDVETPWGAFRVVARSGRVVRIFLPGRAADSMLEELGNAFPEDEVAAADGGVIAEARTQLLEYVQGERRHFELPLEGQGTTFQQKVWAALSDIPFGETRSYADIAEAVGRPGAARAVGQANARNPIPLVVPCHRVIAADGRLGGYMGVEAPKDGLKARLLRHEAAWMN